MNLARLAKVAFTAVPLMGSHQADAWEQRYYFPDPFERGLNSGSDHPYYNKIIIQDPKQVAALAALTDMNDPDWNPNCVILYHAVAAKEQDTLHFNLQGCRTKDLGYVYPVRENKKPLAEPVNPRCITIMYVRKETEWDNFEIGFNMIDVENLRLHFKNLEIDTAENPPLDFLIKHGIAGTFDYCQHDPRQEPKTVGANAAPMPGKQ